VSSDDHRLLVEAQAGFHRGRWHASEHEAGQTVSGQLERGSVEGINPYHVLPRCDDPAAFECHRGLEQRLLVGEVTVHVPGGHPPRGGGTSVARRASSSFGVSTGKSDSALVRK
jgi:hypothetical protein